MNEFFAGFFLLQPPAEFEQKHNFLTISFSYFFMYHLAFFVLKSDFGRYVSGSLIVISRCYKTLLRCRYRRAIPLLSSLVKNSIIELTTDYSFCFLAAMPDALPAADS